jgi:hypothetical protein
MCELVYGAGLRIRECGRFRVTDADLDRRQLVVRSGREGGTTGVRRPLDTRDAWGAPAA